MAPLIVGVIVGLVVVVLGLWAADRIDAGTFHLPLLTLHSRVRRWWRARRGDPPRMVDCLTCHQTLPVDQAHIVVAVPDDDDEASIGMGGTAMVAEYHPEHCPGGCQHQHAA